MSNSEQQDVNCIFSNRLFFEYLKKQMEYSFEKEGNRIFL